ncbi:MAG: AI-2E family transporter [Saprospiraceae bacterium]|nr:AI-2E family transporter [Saprospiraceae bacterium]
MWQKYHRYIIGGFLLLLILFLLSYFSEVVSYILISWVISMIGQPIMNFLLVKLKLLRFSWAKSISALLTMLTIFAIIGSILWMFIPIVIQQAVVLSKVDFNSISLALQEPIDNVNIWLRSLGLEPSLSAADQVKSFLGSYFDPKNISIFFGSLLSQAGNILIGIFSILFISFFFLKERGLFTDIILAVVPTGTEKKVREVINDVSELLTKYFGGIAVQMFVLMIISTALLSLIGIKNALLISFFYAIMNIIPYLGPLIGAAFGCMLTISSNLDMNFYSQTIPLLTMVLLVFLAVKLLDDFIIQPYIFSKRVQAHPLEIFIVIMVGARLDGIIGMVLAIPFYTIFRVVARVFLIEFKIISKITEDLETASSKDAD